MTLRTLDNIMVDILAKQLPDYKKLRNYYLFESDKTELKFLTKTTRVFNGILRKTKVPVF